MSNQSKQGNNMKAFSYLLTGLLLAATAEAAIHVDAGNTGTEDGASWATAFNTVQEGIDAAETAGDPEVWVAAGTYAPTGGTLRRTTILLKSNIAVYGGFDGTETDRSMRDWIANPTILSGNIGDPGLATDNSFHVVSCTNATGAVLDGFTIRDGYADGPNTGGGANTGLNSTSAEAIVAGINHSAGGGIINFQAAASFYNCIVTNNHAGKAGGAYNMVSTTARGSDDDPNPYYENCTFVGNTSGGRGGAVQNDVATHPAFVNCRFLDNTCDGKGGGMYNDFYCSPFLTNCVFAGNYAIMAGAMGNDGSSSPTIVNCTFANNEAWDKGAAIYNGSHSASATANLPTIVNCIFFGNTITTAPGPTDLEVWHDNFPDITYSIVEEGYAGTGNMTGDPLFADAANHDFILVHGSPAIDAGTGNRTADIDGIPCPLDGDNNGSALADIGAHEYACAAADTDGDGMLDGWELGYGFNPRTAEDGTADSDLDGMDNADESIADTDPRDGNSLFEITAFSSASGTNEIVATASANRQYSLLYSTNLPAGEWVVASNQLNQAGSAEGVGFAHRTDATQIYYRVQVSVP
ncbi:hypothetical protein PDESU_04265 [Pontiella desulfatans]|uniref:Probable pectate lyase C n=1 Tax=Pontiella desulfatans TaxID=2750659 RepID=A0A6C2U6N7_PONDE|nr:choice-of-anchor Q domain-containing protein [Pontiella desulfatans]VGO15680.1 hypothetical protein PDESU_04265 [Pontiella desulfatans]